MSTISYSGYRFPPEIIHRVIWLYLRFTLSFRDVEDVLAERGITVSYETVRRWVYEIASNHDPSQNRNNSLIAHRNVPTGWGHVSRER